MVSGRSVVGSDVNLAYTAEEVELQQVGFGACSDYKFRIESHLAQHTSEEIERGYAHTATGKHEAPGPALGYAESSSEREHDVEAGALLEIAESGGAFACASHKKSHGAGGTIHIVD